MRDTFYDPQAVFEALPNYFDPQAIGHLQAVIQFELNGDGGGQWYVSIANGELKVNIGQAANPNVTLSLAAQDYVAIVNGDLNPMQALMQGRVRVQGDAALLMKLRSALAID